MSFELSQKTKPLQNMTLREKINILVKESLLCPDKYFVLSRDEIQKNGYIIQKSFVDRLIKWKIKKEKFIQKQKDIQDIHHSLKDFVIRDKTKYFDTNYQNSTTKTTTKNVMNIHKIDSSIEQFYKSETFENQREFGKQINDCFFNEHKYQILAKAPTQSGKTGSMLALIYEYLSRNPDIHKPNNVFIFTPHSSVEWVKQTKQRFPPILRPHIYHRNQLITCVNEIKKCDKNILLIVDEAHVASKYGQALFQLYKSLCLYSPDKMIQNNFRIALFTATPESIEQDLVLSGLCWKDISATVTMNVPENYISHEVLHSKNVVFQNKDLCGMTDKNDPFKVDFTVYDNIIEILNFLDKDKPQYHIIRTHRGIQHYRTIQNFIDLFASADFIQKHPEISKNVPQHLALANANGELFRKIYLISEPLLPKGMDINHLLIKTPKKHAFIFIKDKLRCAKTIHLHNIGVLYERKVKKSNPSTMIQGLAGRATGINKGLPSAVFYDYKSTLPKTTCDNPEVDTSHDCGGRQDNKNIICETTKDNEMIVTPRKRRKRHNGFLNFMLENPVEFLRQ